MAAGSKRTTWNAKSCQVAEVTRSRTTGIRITKQRRKQGLNDSHTPRNRCLEKIRFVNIPRTIKTKLQVPSVLMANVRSVFNKVDEVRLRADKHKTSLIVLTESWLNADTPDLAIAIKRYDIIRKDRGSHGGGSLIINRFYCRMKITAESYKALQQRKHFPKSEFRKQCKV